MGSELVRFGVAMDAELLARFDQHIARRGYETRSEALRDLVRGELSQERIEGGGQAVATLTIVYDHHVRELTEKLTEMQHSLGECVVSTLHVHLDHDHCLEVIVLRGPADVLQREGDHMIATKGVEVGRMVITATPIVPTVAPTVTAAPTAQPGKPTTHTHSHGGGPAHSHPQPAHNRLAPPKPRGG